MLLADYDMFSWARKKENSTAFSVHEVFLDKSTLKTDQRWPEACKITLLKNIFVYEPKHIPGSLLGMNPSLPNYCSHRFVNYDLKFYLADFAWIVFL